MRISFKATRCEGGRASEARTRSHQLTPGSLAASWRETCVPSEVASDQDCAVLGRAPRLPALGAPHGCVGPVTCETRRSIPPARHQDQALPKCSIQNVEKNKWINTQMHLHGQKGHPFIHGTCSHFKAVTPGLTTSCSDAERPSNGIQGLIFLFILSLFFPPQGRRTRSAETRGGRCQHVPAARVGSSRAQRPGSEASHCEE